MSLTDSSAIQIAKSASTAALTLARLSLETRNSALQAVHDALLAAKPDILAANAADLAAAAKSADSGELSQSLVKRLDLARPGKYDDMLKGILDVKGLPDPIGHTTLHTELDTNLILTRISCPIGVLLIIFEARPEVIANIASLAIKSGNAAILKGGKESTASFRAIAHVVASALASTPIPATAIQLVTTRDSVDALLQQDRHVNLVIPRGGNALVRYVKAHTAIPVLGHADGLCVTFLCGDMRGDAERAAKVLVDAKCGYPAACNATETLLVDENGLGSVWPVVARALMGRGVQLRCDALSKEALRGVLEGGKFAGLVQDAKDEDYDTEFLDLILAVKTVPGGDEARALDFAIAHVNAHSSHHTDAILTSSREKADYFLMGVDSAGVYWNTSTRMADGMRYGFGTEVGISTNKIHSRGPVGLEGLTIYKYVIRGDMQSSGEYGEGEGMRTWKHRTLALD